MKNDKKRKPVKAKRVLKCPRQRYARSKGHIQFTDGYEYYLYEDKEVLKAPVENNIDIQTGNRLGAVFVCTRRMARVHRLLWSNKKFQKKLEKMLEGRRD